MANSDENQTYYINEEEARILIEAEVTTIRIPSYAEKFELSDSERKSRADRVLEMWRKKV